MTFATTLSPADIYRIHNKRKKTYKKIGQILSDICFDQENNIDNGTLYLKKIHIKYNIDERTIKRYLSGFIYKIGKNSILLINDSDMLVIKETTQAIRRYLNLKDKHKKISKYVTYNLLSIGQTQN